MEESLTKIVELPKFVYSICMITIIDLDRNKRQFSLCKCFIFIYIDMCLEFKHEVECCTNYSNNDHSLCNCSEKKYRIIDKIEPTKSSYIL